MTVLICLLLLASAAWSIDPPDSVWVESREDGFVTLAWTLVPDAGGYEVYREVVVTTGINQNGEVVLLDEPLFAFVFWGTAEQSGLDPVRVRVAKLDNDPSRWAVSAVKDGEVSEWTETADMPTAIRKPTWGEVKAGR